MAHMYQMLARKTADIKETTHGNPKSLGEEMGHHYQAPNSGIFDIFVRMFSYILPSMQPHSSATQLTMGLSTPTV